MVIACRERARREVSGRIVGQPEVTDVATLGHDCPKSAFEKEGALEWRKR
jgi:hypothetical protein